jgi:hypothetical protein
MTLFWGWPKQGTGPKEAVPPEKMTLDVAQNGYKLNYTLQHVGMTLGADSEAGVDYTALVLFGIPDTEKQAP